MESSSDTAVTVTVCAGLGTDEANRGAERVHPDSQELDTSDLAGSEADRFSEQQVLLEEEFYKRLLELKGQHKKTLKSMEALYHSSTIYRDYNSDDEYSRRYSSAPVNSVDQCRGQWREGLSGTALLLEDFGGECESGMGHLSYSPGQSEMRQHHSSNSYTSCFSDEISSDDQVEPAHPPRRTDWTDPMRLVDGMWSDFSLGDYSSPDLLPASKSSSFSWSPNFTTPEPFQMTLRDEEKARAGLVHSSPCIQEAEHLRREKEARESAELRYQFCARDVPRTTSEPRYARLCQERSQKREQARQKSMKRLQEIQEPFSFIEREKAKHQEKVKRAMQLTAEHKNSSQKFFAKAVPKQLFAREKAEQCLEEELYRQLRIRMRSEELLASSHLPPSMSNREASRRYTIGKLRLRTAKERAQLAGLSNDHHFHPHINHMVPNFGELHRELAQNLNSQKYKQPSTVVEPFFLRTSLLGKSKKCSCNSLHSETSHLADEQAVSVRAPPATTYVPDADASHSRSTKSSRLYRYSVRSKAEERLRTSEQRAREVARKEERKRTLSQQVTTSVLNHDHTPFLEQEAHEKLQAFR